MGTGWRRAFCTSIRRDPDPTTPTTRTSSSSSLIFEQQQQQEQQSPTSSSGGDGGRCVKLGIFSAAGGGGSSNPSTPRLHSSSSTPRCPNKKALSSPKLECKTMADAASVTTSTATTTPSSTAAATSVKKKKNIPMSSSSSSSSPRSPSTFALFKTALRLSRNRCGVCGESVRRAAVGQSVAVFTAECSHAFHFPCISTHVGAQRSLICPVCSATWHDSVPLLASSLRQQSRPPVAADADDGKQQHVYHAQQHHQIGGGGGNVTIGSKLEDQLAPSPRSRERSSSSRGRREGERAAAKIYDDDESLQLSPTSGLAGGVLQFNTIPEGSEEDEDEDEDDGEGVSDNGQCEDHCDIHGPSRSGGGINAVISVMAESLALVSTGRNHLNYVVSIKVKSPPLPSRPQAAAAAAGAVTGSGNKLAGTIAPGLVPPSLLDHPSCRAPIDLVTVLDVSGGMTVAKLQMLKRAMRLVISSLGPGDRLSIVAFSMAAAKRLFPLRRMSRAGQRSARQIVDRLVICGSSQAQGPSHHCSATSCVGDALRKATKVLEDRRERNPVATIMLLSDGHRHGHGHGQQPGLQDQQQNAYNANATTTGYRQPTSGTRFTHIEIPIHASSRIQDMQQKQRTSSRNDGIPAEAEEEDAIAKCVNGLVSVVLQDVHLQFTIPSDCGEISSVYSCSYSYGGGGGCDGTDGGAFGRAMSHGEGGKSISLGDMYAGEERQLLLELKVPKAALVGGHAMSISVLCSYKNPLTQDVIRCGERPLVMPTMLPPLPPTLLRSSSSDLTSTTLSTQQQQRELRNLFVTTRAMVESRRLVDLNDTDTAIHLLSSARSLLLQQSKADSNTLKALVLTLEARLEDLQRRRQQQTQQQQQRRRLQSVSPSHRSEQPLLVEVRGGGEPLTPTSAWRVAEQLAKVAITRKSLNRVSDLHGLEDARF